MPIHQVWFEDVLISLLKANVAVAIPLFILLLKLVVLRISGDLDELFRSLVSIPLEILLIAIGIVFAGIGRTIPFETRLHSDTMIDLAGAVFILVLSAVLAIFYRLNKKLVVRLQKFFSAMDSVRIHLAQPDFKFDSKPATWKIAWAAYYLMSALLWWGVEGAISVYLLWQTFLRIS